MKMRIDIRIDQQRLADIRAYCQKHDKTVTAFFEKGLDLMFQKYNVKGEYRPKRKYWNAMINTRKYF